MSGSEKRCDRFEREGLALLEQGRPLDEHFETCPDCVAARRAYESLMQEIAVAGDELEPSPEWRARVWERIEERDGRGVAGFFHRFAPVLGAGTWVPTRIAVPVAAVILLAVVFVVWLATPGAQISISSTVVAQGTVLRGEEAHPGDSLRLEATTGGSPHAEMRVYFNDRQVVLSCSSEPPCRVDGDTLTAEIVLESLGSYQPLLLTSAQPLPAPTGDLDRDAGAALGAGAAVEMGERVVVR